MALWGAEWTIDDNFDFVPGEDEPSQSNVAAGLLGLVWYDRLQARKNAPIQVRWAETGTLLVP